ncbi:RES family NAD+ phosphorylase [Pseudomonas sp. SDO528_S397]
MYFATIMRKDDEHAMAENVNVCSECVYDPFLVEQIRLKGCVVACGLCNSTRTCWPLREIVFYVEGALDKHLCVGTHRHVDSDNTTTVSHGESAEHWISLMFGSAAGELIVGAVCSNLKYFQRDGKYLKRPHTHGHIGLKWGEFEEGVRHGNRFFNKHAREYLDWLFEGVHTYSAESESLAVVRVLTPEHALPIYRARTCMTPAGVQEINADPAIQLAAPPRALAGEGRMNPAGVPVFYGAFERITCVAELRPPVGGTVVSGEFRLTEPVSVLDFKRFETADLGPEPSVFDPDYFLKSGRREFLKYLHDMITAPVPPGSERNYLVSQFIAEYLATCVEPCIDGVIFKSVQDPSGSNIALFSHAVCVETALQWEFQGSVGVRGPKQRAAPRIEYVNGSLVQHVIDAVKYFPIDKAVV